MANKTGSITLSTTGNNKQFTGLGFQPTKLKFTVGPVNGASSINLQSTGAVDSAGNQWVVNQSDDHNGHYTYNQSTSDCIYLRTWNGSTWVNELKANFSGYLSDGFELDVTAANSNYSVFFEASN